MRKHAAYKNCICWIILCITAFSGMWFSIDKAQSLFAHAQKVTVCNRLQESKENAIREDWCSREAFETFGERSLVNEAARTPGKQALEIWTAVVLFEILPVMIHLIFWMAEQGCDAKNQYRKRTICYIHSQDGAKGSLS